MSTDKMFRPDKMFRAFLMPFFSFFSGFRTFCNAQNFLAVDLPAVLLLYLPQREQLKRSEAKTFLNGGK